MGDPDDALYIFVYFIDCLSEIPQVLVVCLWLSVKCSNFDVLLVFKAECDEYQFTGGGQLYLTESVLLPCKDEDSSSGFLYIHFSVLSEDIVLFGE